MKLKPDGSLAPYSVEDGNRNGYLFGIGANHDAPVTQAALPEGFPWFWAEPDKSCLQVIVPNVWRWCFAMHLDGTPWLGELIVPDEAIALAAQVLSELQEQALVG